MIPLIPISPGNHQWIKSGNLIVIPITMAVTLIGIIWIAGLALSRCRREYILQASRHMTEVLTVLADVDPRRHGKQGPR
jgi:hypothetical protein